MVRRAKVSYAIGHSYAADDGLFGSVLPSLLTRLSLQSQQAPIVGRDQDKVVGKGRNAIDGAQRLLSTLIPRVHDGTANSRGCLACWIAP